MSKLIHSGKYDPPRAYLEAGRSMMEISDRLDDLASKERMAGAGYSREKRPPMPPEHVAEVAKLTKEFDRLVEARMKME